jgi:hypothetical protein
MCKRTLVEALFPALATPPEHGQGTSICATIEGSGASSFRAIDKLRGKAVRGSRTLICLGNLECHQQPLLSRHGWRNGP